jgi:hypothetical protein
MSNEKIRASSGGSIISLLFTSWVVLATHLINKYVFNYGLSRLMFWLLVVLVILVAYPVFGWKRKLSWKRIGQWTFSKWVIFAVTLGVFGAILDLLISLITPYFYT